MLLWEEGHKMISRFLDYVEIRTKITSLFAFMMTISYLIWIKQPIRGDLTVIFFASMFVFDLTTTAINNYIDTKNNHQTLQFKRRTAFIIICVLFIIGAVLGLYLAYKTDLVVLFAGGFCFLCGVFYTYGPVPISRMPLGELLSGVFYGFFIPFLLLYINMPGGTFLTYSISKETITLGLNIKPFLILFMLSVIPFCATANIMLANNICDLEKDIMVKRHTLPYYIGKNSLHLFAGLYYLAYIDLILLVIFSVLSPFCLLALLSILPVQKNIQNFFVKQEKSTTFIMAIKNYVLLMGSVVLVILISGIIF